jgi:hypothetical protein
VPEYSAARPAERSPRLSETSLFRLLVPFTRARRSSLDRNEIWGRTILYWITTRSWGEEPNGIVAATRPEVRSMTVTSSEP